MKNQIISLYGNWNYKKWYQDIKEKIKSSQQKAVTKVNAELITLYWEIVEKQKRSNWRDALIEQLSKDLCAEFETQKGFSRSNLFDIRKWFLFYNNRIEKVRQATVEVTVITEKYEFVSQLVGQIPWGHNREIATKCTAIQEALFYVTVAFILSFMYF